MGTYLVNSITWQQTGVVHSGFPKPDLKYQSIPISSGTWPFACKLDQSVAKLHALVVSTSVYFRSYADMEVGSNHVHCTFALYCRLISLWLSAVTSIMYPYKYV